MKKKLRIALVFGGRSAEHEVSITSAKNIYQALDRNKYDITLIGIDKKGSFVGSLKPQDVFVSSMRTSSLSTQQQHSLVTSSKNSGIHPSAVFSSQLLDVVFPVLHGPYGEDGTIQGMCKMLNIPFVGPDVLGSAIGMDKDVTKRLLRDGGIPIARFRVVTRKDDVSFRTIAGDLGVPFFLKPANLGSSIGVAKVTSEKEFKAALSSAFAFDNKVLIEEAIQGREIECSVLGNEEPVASVAGEIVPKGHDFYDYEAKYLDENGAELIVPANIPKATLKQIQSLALKTFQILCCEGMARVDFFLTKNNEIFVNEINTIPGFTNISMYPKLWEASGVSYPELIDRLVTLAIERQRRDAVHKSTRS